MKILLLTYEYPPFKGGVATYLENLVKSAPADTQIDVQIPPQGEYWCVTGFKLLAKVVKNKYDYVAVSHVIPAGYIAWKYRFGFGVPYIVFTHGTDILSFRQNSWKRFWARYILRQAKFVIANSRFTAGLLHEEGIKKIEIITPSVVANTGSPIMPRLDDKGHRILSVGRLTARKGFDTMIKAMPEILKQFPDATYTVIGRGDYQAQLEKLVIENKLEKSVKILVNIEDKSPYLNQATVFALPARKIANDVEGFGIVTLEASAAGLPVVVGRSGGAPETVVDGVTGIVVEPDDAAALALAIISLLRHPEEARKMGQAGAEYVAKEYSSEAVGKRFWNLLK